MKRYNNYHKHTMYSNLRSLDCIVKPIEYINRAKELDGEKAIYFSTEHGYQGNIHELYTLCQIHNVKLIAGAEVYYVEDKNEKDKTNYHMVLIAKNKSGYKQLNKILSIANLEGFYYKPRIDDELLFNLNPNDFIITTACVAGRLKNDEGLDEWIIKMKEHFGNNFYLEVQSHIHDVQIKHNKKVLFLSSKHNVELIHANDSHYIYPQDARYRDLFLKAKGIVYAEEEGFLLDYPSYEEIVERYRKQNVLTDEQIEKSLSNTLIFDELEGITLDTEIKIPHISDNPNQELKEIINEEWQNICKEIPVEEHEKYLKEIRYEFDIIEKTNMEEYFIMDYKIVKEATKKYNGLMTKTGRGSAPSFYINKLLGLTDIDRISAKVPLYPTRFMSIERILGTRSLPDIDLNTENRIPFIKATEDLLGKDNCAWMLSFKPLQDSSAFRLWCKANDMNIKKYDDIAKNLEDYVEDEYWGEIIEESKVFKGVIESMSESPCSQLVWDKDISEEIGIIKTKEGICCNIDGYNCDVYKYLKNDLLTVTVWSIIRQTCELANIEIPSIKELEELLDEKTYAIYKNKLTCTINQADSKFATDLIAKYEPQSVAEMSAFVASIRPGFASLLDNFIERMPYSTGITDLDILLEDSYHYLMYQESIMKYLIWLGIKESESYDIIKKIAKKKFKEEELRVLKEKLKNSWIKIVGEEKGFDETWQVVEDASHYSFNASHSLSYAYDSLYGAYLKAHYPLEYYSVAFTLYEDDIERTARLTEELKYFGIKLENPKFRYARAGYFIDRENNAIYKGVSSIKYLNKNVAEDLYQLKDNEYPTFMDLLIDLKNININSRQLDILVRLDYFSEFGKRKKLLDIIKIFNSIYGKKQFKKTDFKEELIRQFAKSESEKMFKDVDTYALCKYLMSTIEDEDLSMKEIIEAERDYIGRPIYIDENLDPMTLIVLDVNTKYTPKIQFYSPLTGNIENVKIEKRIFKKQPLEFGDMIIVFNIYEKFRKTKNENGQWIETENTEFWIDDYRKIED